MYKQVKENYIMTKKPLMTNIVMILQSIIGGEKKEFGWNYNKPKMLK